MKNTILALVAFLATTIGVSAQIQTTIDSVVEINNTSVRVHHRYVTQSSPSCYRVNYWTDGNVNEGNTGQFCVSAGNDTTSVVITGLLPSEEYFFEVMFFYPENVRSSQVSFTTAECNYTPVISAGSTTICAGDQTTLTANPGMVSYQWLIGGVIMVGQNASSLSVSTTGTYTCRMTDQSGCVATSNAIAITVNPSLSSTQTLAICAGESVNVGNNSYNTTGVFTNTLVSQVTGCDSTVTLILTVNPSLSSTQTLAICAGESVNVGNNSYSTTGTFTNTLVSQVTGCDSTVTLILTVNPSLSSTQTLAICAGESVTVGNNSYSTTGTFTNTLVSQVTGCDSTVTLILTVNALPLVSSVATSDEICLGSSTTLIGTGATSYTWTPGNLSGSSVSVSPTVTTTYSVVGVDANGCTGTSSVPVTVNSLPAVNAGPDIALCFGESTTITPISYTGSSIAWYGEGMAGCYGNCPTLVLNSVEEGGTYTVQVTLDNGCPSVFDQVNITVNALPTIGASALPAEICNGESTTLTGTGAATYTWSPGNQTGSSIIVSPNANTSYTVVGVDANGCEGSDVVNVEVNSVSISAQNVEVCVGSPAVLTASGASIYTWVPGNLSGASVVVNPTGNTVYTVTATDLNGCTTTEDVNVNVNALPTIGASALPAEICNGESTTLTGTGAATYTWSPGNQTGSSIIVSPNANTSYTVVGVDANGCENTADVFVEVHSVSVAAEDVVICQGSSAVLTASGAITYLWTPGNQTGPTIMVSPTTNTAYTVTGTDMNGCTSSASVDVVLLPSPYVEISASESVVCVNSTENVYLTGFPIGGFFSGNGVVGNTLNPTNAGAGFAEVLYTYTDGNGCVADATAVIQVSAAPILMSWFWNGWSTFIVTGSFPDPISLTIAGQTYYTSNQNGTEAIFEGVYSVFMYDVISVQSELSGCFSYLWVGLGIPELVKDEDYTVECFNLLGQQVDESSIHLNEMYLKVYTTDGGLQVTEKLMKK